MAPYALTCCVSNLPIEPGDKVRYFLITKDSRHPGHVPSYDPNHVWFPRTFPILATYHWEGNLHRIQNGPEHRSWLKGLKRDTFPKLQKKQPIKSYAQLEEALSRGDVWVYRVSRGEDQKYEIYGQSPTPVSRALIREDIWQELLTFKHANETIESYRRNVKRIAAQIRRISDPRDQSIFLLGLSPVRGGWGFNTAPTMFVSLSLQVQLMLTSKAGLTPAFVNTMAEFTFVSDILHDCRHQWRPSTNCGPSESFWKNHLRLNEGIARVTKAAMKPPSWERR